ncbi:hypothetical protein AB0K12_45645 [Nonomuraea sp. NPDC049419]|uniref:hypothetical protein n=1 Tax=Nonomuraea sp. NPDC049419 TaxID=3155772 RepID=UPI00343A02D0
MKALAVASGTALLLISGASSANAQTAQAADCFKVVDQGYTIALEPWVKVKNNCAWNYNIIVVWKLGLDSPCMPIKQGETRRSQSQQSAIFDKVKIC